MVDKVLEALEIILIISSLIGQGLIVRGLGPGRK
jgi:hypothetical protein